MSTCRYILVYPQGCDVCNHLSLFLCVADYDKLLPGELLLTVPRNPLQHRLQCIAELLDTFLDAGIIAAPNRLRL